MVTDIHTHIIPDVDDGALDLAMSLDIIEDAVRQGATEIFATSHHFAYLDGAEPVKIAYHLLEDAIEQLHIPIRLYLGCEILCMPRWMERILSGLASGEYPSMNGTHYVLVEFTMFNIEFDDVVYCIDRLLAAGWIPILAHIERYVYSYASLDNIDLLRKKGCLVQMNAYSIFEEEDRQIKALVHELLSCQMIDFLGSDAHGPKHRPPMLANGIKYMYEHYDRDYIDQVVHKNARTYLIPKDISHDRA